MLKRDLIQYLGTLFTRGFAKLFWMFPVQTNKVVFTSFIGKQHSCNPLYIQKYLEEKYPNKFELIWFLRNNPQEYSNAIKFLSLKHFYHFCTARVIVDNGGMPTYMPKRKTQYVINTWHGGGAYKRGSELNQYSKYRIYLEKYKGKNTDLFLSSCEEFTRQAIPDILLNYSGEIMPCGCPRNDIFWSTNEKKLELKDKIHKIFSIPKDVLIVLFAPTFREFKKAHYKFNQQIKWENILKAIETRFDRKTVVVFRAHNYMSQYDIGKVIDATFYPDMQELLCAADILISDYSSTIWDFSFTKKPCFLYCPDLDYYLNQDRGVYTPVETWPGVLCRTNEELEQAILNFDESKYLNKVEKHHVNLGSYENGSACEQVCKRIAEVCGIERVQ